jgi:hypothetical protein
VDGTACGSGVRGAGATAALLAAAPFPPGGGDKASTKRPKKSSAILREVASISREPI